ncbi:MAG: hypothetical protein RSB44_07800, partial [Carnobacterium sp.]
MSQNNHFHYLLKRLGSSITDTEELTALSVTFLIKIKEIKKLDNKEAKDMEVKKLNFTGTVNKKYLETGKIMFEIHNKGTKETIK